MSDRSLTSHSSEWNAIAKIIQTRRTVNDFREDIPPAATVLQAIELASWAPNHKMTEPWRFHLIGSLTVEKLIGINRDFLTSEKGAEFAEKKLARWPKIPGWIIVTSQRSPDPLRERENYAAVCCAIQNLMLMLWSERIGTKWVTGPFLQLPQTADLLQMDRSVGQIAGLIWYGYPASIPTSKRKPVSEITIVHP